MFSTLTLCVTMAGRFGICPPQLDHPWNPLRERAVERLHREFLERNKSRVVFLEEMIEWWEKLAADSTLHTPAEANKLRQDVPHWRAHLQHMKNVQVVLEWYEQQQKLNPGPKTEREAMDRLDKLIQEWDLWEFKWERGLIAPPPRVKK